MTNARFLGKVQILANGQIGKFSENANVGIAGIKSAHNLSNHNLMPEMNKRLQKIRKFTKNTLKTIEKNFPQVANKSYAFMKNLVDADPKSTDKNEAMLKLYNALIDYKREQVASNKKLYKSLPSVDSVDLGKRVKRQDRGNLRPYHVAVSVVERNEKKDDGFTWETTRSFNVEDDGKPLIFYSDSVASVAKDVEAYVSGKYPIEFDYEWTHFESMTFTATLPPKKRNINQMNIPMHLSLPYKLCFLKHFNDIDEVSYENHEGECVLKTLTKHLKITEMHLFKCFNEISQELYKRDYKKKHGITSQMLLEFCKSKNISLLGFNSNDKMFVKFANDDKRTKKYKSIVYYMAMGHFYILTDEKVVRHLSQSYKEGNCSVRIEPTEAKPTEPLNVYYDLTLDECLKLPPNSMNILEKESSNIEAMMKECLERKIVPKVKYQCLSVMKEIQLDLGKKHTVRIVIGEGRKYHLSTKNAKKVCDVIGFPFENQSIGTLLVQIENNYFKPAREPITAVMRETIVAEQKGLCAMCNDPMKKVEIDHIQPVASGGKTERANLHGLCPECHREKSSDEQSDYTPRCDFTSSLNIQANEIMQKVYSRKVAFNHFFEIDRPISTYKIYESQNLGRFKCADINKCRRNLLLYGGYNFPVYSVLDSWNKFNGVLEDGNYYVETDNYFPFRGNGVYNLAMVQYGISEKIITLDNVIYEFKCSTTVKDDYFKGFVEHLLKVFDFDKGAQKLAPNSYIGLMGARTTKYIKAEYCQANNKDEMGVIYEKFKNPFINEITETEWILTDEVVINRLETNFYIHSHILDLEAIEAHKLYNLLKESHCVPICVKTDAIVFYEFSTWFDISEHFFDKEKTVLKYKFEEEVKFLEQKSSILKNTEKMVVPFKKYEMYENADIYMDNNYSHIADKIIESNKGCLCLGSAGTGKSYLLNKVVEKLEALGKKYLRLAPTNKSALIIGGETLDKFCHSLLSSIQSINKAKKYDYIFVDEISMVRESFYRVLIFLKHENPDIKFVICGDFHQLPPVLDRINNRSYKNSRVLRELVDNQKLNLDVCKRSDSVLFNLCEQVKKGEKIDIARFKNKRPNDLNICYTNECRKIVNRLTMNRFLKTTKEETRTIHKLSYDENSQEYTLCKGMPLIARRNLKSEKIVNTETYRCEGFSGDKVILSCDEGEIIFPLYKLKQYFHLAFAITTHKSQGATFDKPYTIHEWDKMDKTLRYVALSRATDINNISIC